MDGFAGAIGVSDSDGKSSPVVHCYLPAKDVDPRFYAYLLRDAARAGFITSLAKGIRERSTAFDSDTFRSLRLPVPDYRVQRTIADFLDAETARIDALIDKKRDQSELLDLRWAALVTDLVRGRNVGSAGRRRSDVDWIEELPDGWGTPTVGMMFDVQLGKMLNQRAAEGENQLPYLRNQNVQWDRLDLEDLAKMHFDPQELRRFTVRKGDLLVCEGGDVGRAAIWNSDDEIRYQKALHRVRPRTSAPPRFLMYVLWAASTLGVFAIEGNQSTIVHLTREQLRAHRIPWPPEGEQSRIVAELDEARAQMRDVQELLARQAALLAEHRQALITAAVTGQLVVPEAVA